VYEIGGWRRVLLWPLGRLLALWGRTLRLEASPVDEQAWRKRDVPVALILWHNRKSSGATGPIGRRTPW
jgi:hypothetical protein